PARLSLPLSSRLDPLMSQENIHTPMKPSPGRQLLLSACMSLIIALVTLIGLEILLRVADFRELRDSLSEQSLNYDYDAELGWAPAPGSSGTVVTFRTTHFKHNSLGLRDDEFSLDAKPTI